MYTAARLASTGRAAVFLRVKPSRKMRLSRSAERDKRKILKNLSADYGQSTAEAIPDRPTLFLHLLCQKGRCHCYRLALGVLRAGGAVLGQQTHRAGHIPARQYRRGA